jgi:hypothetical protein
LGLVVVGWVEDDLADELAVVGEDADVAPSDEDCDAPAGVVSAEAGVERPTAAKGSKAVPGANSECCV